MSLFFSTFLYGGYALSFFPVALLFYTLTRLAFFALKKKFAILIAFVLYEVFIYLSLNVLPRHAPDLFYYAFVFAVLFSIRYILFVLYLLRNKPVYLSVADFVLYGFFPPFLIICPHIFVLPGYEYFHSGLRRSRLSRLEMRAASKLICLGLLQVVAASLTFDLLDLSTVYETLNIMTVVVKRPLVFFTFIFYIAGVGNILVAIINLLGYQIHPPFNRPLLSSNIMQFFDRFMIYFKTYIFEGFYLPMLIHFRKLKWRVVPYLCAVVSIPTATVLYYVFSLGLMFCNIFNGEMLSKPGGKEFFKSYMFNSPLLVDLVIGTPFNKPNWFNLHAIALASFLLWILVAPCVLGIYFLQMQLEKATAAHPWPVRGILVVLQFLIVCYVLFVLAA